MTGKIFILGPKIPSGGGRTLINVRFLSRIPHSAMRPGELSEQKALFSKVIAHKGQLYSARSRGELFERVESFIETNFLPDRFVIGERDDTQDGAGRLLEFALKENRGIYIPDTLEPRAVVTGNTPISTHDLYSGMLSSLEINASLVRGSEFKSIAVVPVVSGMDRNLPVEEYHRHGALLLYSMAEDLLNGQAGLPPLRMLANFIGVALSSLKA